MLTSNQMHCFKNNFFGNIWHQARVSFYYSSYLFYFFFSFFYHFSLFININDSILGFQCPEVIVGDEQLYFGNKNYLFDLELHYVVIKCFKITLKETFRNSFVLLLFFFGNFFLFVHIYL